MSMELKIDAATQETILLGAARAMTDKLQVNAMRREGDAVVLYWDDAKNGHSKLTLAERLARWMP